MKELLHKAMQFLAGQCDGAVEQDGVGFAKGDSYNGKYMASIPVSQWTDSEDSLAHYFAQKYRNQIRHILDLEPRYERSFPTEDAEEVSSKRKKVYNKPVPIAKYEGGLLITETPYNADFVVDSKKILSRKYVGGNVTTFRPLHLKEFIALCDKYEIELEFDPKTVVIPTTTAPYKKPTKQNTVKIVDKQVVIEFEYTQETYVLVSSLGCAKWEPETKTWTSPINNAGRIAVVLGAKGFILDESLKEAQNQLSKNKEEFQAKTTSFRIDLPQLREGFEVLDHQWVAVDWALKNRSFLNADSQGLGKTFESFITLIAANSKKTVIIAPASLTENWKKESHMFFVDGTFTPFMAEGRTPGKIPEDANLVILSWDVFTNWVDTLTAWNPEAIIVDEAHYGKSGNGAKRGKAFIEFGKAHKKQLKIALTGTPILNRPLELLAILQFLGAEKLFGGITKYKNRYCGPATLEVTIRGEKKTIYTFNGASHIDELHDILSSSGIYMRRTKQILIDQGLLKHKYVNGVEFFDYSTAPTPTYLALSPDERADYMKVSEDFKIGLEFKKVKLAGEMGLHPNHPKVINALASNKSGEALVLLNEFRKRIAMLKMRAILEHVNKLVDKGEKVILFAHHREVVDTYADQFSGIKIQGGMGSKKIELAKKKFNETPQEENPVLVVSIEAGKTGHTLLGRPAGSNWQTCNRVIFAEEPYVYGDFEQASDRAYRIGQDRDVYIDNLIVKDTIDETIFRMRSEKQKVFNSVVDGVAYDDDEEQSIAQAILREYM